MSQHFELRPFLEMLQPIPAPTEVLEKICDIFLANKTAAIIYMTDRHVPSFPYNNSIRHMSYFGCFLQ